MPIYRFNIDDGPNCAATRSVRIESLTEAKSEAVKAAGQAICAAAASFWDQAEWKMTVTDEIGLTLFELLIIGVEAPACGFAARRASH